MNKFIQRLTNTTMNTFLSTTTHQRPSRASVKTITTAARFLFAITGCLILGNVYGQADKRLVLADQYYNAGDYYTAAGLYGQFLNPPVKARSTSDFPLNANRNAEGRTGKYNSKNDILFRQAESYRLANYWMEASALYKQCFQKDSSAFSSALYWYAVCQRSLGNLEEAGKSVTEFIQNYSNGNSLNQSALKEKETINFIRKELARPDTVLYRVNQLHSNLGKEKGYFAPVAMNGQFLITSTQADSVAHGENPYHNRLFITTLSNGIIEAASPMMIEGLDGTFNQGTASMDQSGNRLYFTQWKNVNGEQVSSIYLSTKSLNGWSKPVLLPSINKQGFNSKQPFCSADGKYLFFASDMKGGQGSFDIWYAPILENGKTGTPVNAGTTINTSGNEQAPFYHATSGTLVFSSDWLPGMGGYDLFSSTGWGTEWKTPGNLGYPVNSSRDDVYFYSTGKNILDNAYFSSDRGAACCLTTYNVMKAPKKKIMSGVVYNCKLNEPLADAELTIKDNEGNIVQLKTGSDGAYNFVFDENKDYHITLAKDLFIDTTAKAMIAGRNETAWHTDTLFNAPLCMEKKLVIKVENVVTVYFGFDRSDIDETGLAKLDSIYNILTEDTSATLQISGYTDGKGSVEYNARLSDKRARSCADYLIQKGIDPDRITFESFGACCPVEMELLNGRDNPDGRGRNRRALINISRSSPNP